MAKTITHEDAQAMLARPTSAVDQTCEACGAEFNSSADRVQHIWDNRDDEFEYHGNATDVDYQEHMEEV